MTYIIAADKDGHLCIFDGSLDDSHKVGVFKSFGGVNASEMSQNIAALLDFKKPPHQIEINGQPRYLKTDTTIKGFEIREGMGENHRVCTFTLTNEYADKLIGRMTPDFFVGLCDAMPVPPKPKRHRPSGPKAQTPSMA